MDNVRSLEIRWRKYLRAIVKSLERGSFHILLFCAFWKRDNHFHWNQTRCMFSTVFSTELRIDVWSTHFFKNYGEYITPVECKKNLKMPIKRFLTVKLIFTSRIDFFWIITFYFSDIICRFISIYGSIIKKWLRYFPNKSYKNSLYFNE